MTDTQILFLGFVLVATAIVAVAGAQLAPADSSGIVPRKGRYNWGLARRSPRWSTWACCSTRWA